MAYDTTEAVAKFLSGFQMKITKRERDTVAPDYYVKYLLTLSKGGKDFSTTFVSDPRAFGEPTVTQVFSALADDVLTLQKYSTDEFVDKLYAQGVKPSAALRAYDSCKETNLWMQDELYLSGWEIEEISKTLTTAPPPVTWSSPSDALLRNTRKRKGRSLTISPPANGVCILSTPESVTVSMVA